jgi:hypothetical protein
MSKRLRFFATASADSTLVARGKGIEETVEKLAANQRTEVKAKLNQSTRRRLQKKLEKKSKAKVEVEVTAVDQRNAAATEMVKVTLRAERHPRRS